jgi:hypothetical protein
MGKGTDTRTQAGTQNSTQQQSGSQSGQQTGTQATSGMTTTGANPIAMQAYQDMLARAFGIASTPYQAYGGELVAPMNAQQNAGIGGINQYANYAQPFIGAAAGYATEAAAPLTADQIANYQNPYTQQVVNATERQFNNQNAIAQNNVVGNAAAQGALGGDRVGVAQATLAGQQSAAQDPIIANLYSSGYGQAVQTAEQQKQDMANAAYSIGNLGVSGQNAGLTGATAALGAGSLEQQNQQALDTARYGQFQMGQAFPYQQMQWLAGLGTNIGSLMGGTSQTTGAGMSTGATSGQYAGTGSSSGSSYGTTTGPPPNPWASIAGLGLAGIGMFARRGGRVAGYDEGGGVAGVPYAGVGGWVPSVGFGSSGRGLPGAPNIQAPQLDLRLPSMPSMQLPGAPALSAPPQQQQQPSNPFALGQSAMSMAGSGRAGGFRNNLNDAGSQDTIGNILGDLGGGDIGAGDAILTGTGGIYRRGGGIGSFADGGSPDDVNPYGDPSWNQPAYMDEAGGRFNTPPPPSINATDVKLDTGRLGIGRPVQWNNAALASDQSDFNPNPYGDPSFPSGHDPRWAATVSDAGVTAPAFAGSPTYVPPRPVGGTPADSSVTVSGSDVTTSAPRSSGFGFGFLTPAQKSGLMAAGFGMMASRSPFLGTAIGEGGLAGMGAYSGQLQQEQKQAAEKVTQAQAQRRIDLEADRLSQAAETSRKHLALQTQQLAETQHQHRVPAGYREGDEGALEPIPGGPQDPAVVRAQAQAKRLPGMEDDALHFMVQSYRAGNTGVLQGVGRGVQGPDNLNRFWNMLATDIKSEGGTGADLAAAKANFTAQSAAAKSAAVRESQVQSAIEEAKNTFPLALQRSAEVPRTQWVPINNVLEAVRKGTSSPEMARFKAANEAVITAYSQAMSRTGANSVHAQERADSQLKTAMSPEAYEAVIGQLQQEMDAAVKAPETVRKAILNRIGIGWKGEGAAPAPAGGTSATATPAAAAPYRVRQNGHTYERQPDGSMKAID